VVEVLEVVEVVFWRTDERMVVWGLLGGRLEWEERKVRLLR
jgi:hypothetical protein